MSGGYNQKKLLGPSPLQRTNQLVFGLAAIEEYLKPKPEPVFNPFNLATHPIAIVISPPSFEQSLQNIHLNIVAPDPEHPTMLKKVR